MIVFAVRPLGPIACLLLAACRCGSVAAPAPASAPNTEFSIRGAERMVRFEGTCDASGAVAVSERSVAVADDEDNILRVYDAYGGGPSTAIDLSAAIGLQPKGKRGKWPEADIEAGTRIGERAYWITSHGRSSKGQPRPERLRFFATTLAGTGAAQLWGQANEQLLRDMLDDPRFAAFDLGAAAQRAPKAPGGLNIEGLSATPEGHLLIGFRNPNPNQRALLVPLLNPDATLQGGRAQFGDPILLDLKGRGIRAVVPWRGGRYLLVAGHFDHALPSELYVWDGASGLQLQSHVTFGDFNPEAIFVPGTGDQVLVLSDDGESPVDGTPCKKLHDSARKSFRGAWVQIR